MLRSMITYSCFFSSRRRHTRFDCDWSSDVCSSDLHRRVPRPVFDYLDGGAEDEITLRENTRAFQDISFRPRGAVAIKKCALAVSVLGQELSFPAMLAPVGYSRLMHPGGEVVAAKAAGEAGTTYILSP